MRTKQILTTAGIIFFSVVTVLIVLGAVDVGENPISRASVSEGDFDFGDAPADRYSTLQTDDGARHVPGERWLGSPPDMELDGQPHPVALGDDLDGNDDEDGVLFLSPLIPGTTASVSVTASSTGWLNAWLDFHSNNQWADPEDHIFADVELYPGPNSLTFTVPEDAVPGPSFSRWRFSSQTGLSYETGFNEPAPDGEVEDHGVVIGELPAVDSWDKWVNGIPWESSGIDITVQTTDTIQVVDVIRTDRGRPFLLTETWDPEHLGWVDYAIDPPIGAQPEVGDGILTWDVPPDHPEVLVLTKWFHVEPCTWRSTTLVEELLGLEVLDPIRQVGFAKEPPVLGIDALYNRQVLSGAPAQFTLVYSNNGGYENNVSIRNDFPPEAPYIGSIPQATRQDPGGSWAEWDVGDLAMGQQGLIGVEVEIAPGLAPSTTIIITDYIRSHLGEDVASVEIAFHVTGAEEPLFDLGDAPDSTNHTGLPMLTYVGPSSSGVVGNFPSVFDPATGLPQGPRHGRPLADAWLGRWVTLEYDADLMPDQDGVPNLDPPANLPDLDGADDGVSLPVALPDCTPSYITYTVTVTPGAPDIDRFVNVWFDWNRDGDWNDIMTCGVDGDAPEWAVQNQLFPSGSPGTYLLRTPAFLPFNKTPTTPIWMRISIAEQPAPIPPDGSLPDGQGPANGYAFGETEDYYLPGKDLPPGQWIKLINGQPWRPEFSYTVETSDTVEVVDVIHTAPDAPFTLSEYWDPAHLVLLEEPIIEPPLPFPPVIDDGIFFLDVPGEHPEVITVTKRFHVEPCTWEATRLNEVLEGLSVPDPARTVILNKELPVLWLDALYEPEVIPGAPAQFTLVYSNTSGFESAARIRNGFPDEAPYSSSTPRADRQDPNGLWAEWDLGSLAENDRGAIDVVVDILPGLQPSTTVVITDAIYNHAGELEDEVTIRYHVVEPRGWLEGHVMDSETGDLLPPCTQAAVGIQPGALLVPVDPTTGAYGPVDLASGTYTVTASAVGYSIESATVDIFHAMTTTQDFNLWRPVVVVTPTDIISVTGYVSQPVTYQLAIGNHGHLKTDWEILEGPQVVDLPWVSEDPITGTLPPLSEVLVDVTFHCAGVGDEAGTLTILHDDPCEGPVAVPIRLHCLPPQWGKWVNDQPWSQELVVSAQLSDTITVVDVFTGTGTFTLEETWRTEHLRLDRWIVEPAGTGQVSSPRPGTLFWEVDPGPSDVVTITKLFHVEPCTWTETVLDEELWVGNELIERRPVPILKAPPALWIESLYEREVQAGLPAVFTLVYSNTGGYENNVTIRNEFPPEALFIDSDPEPAWQAPDGSQVRWEVGDLGKGDRDSIDVTVAIQSGLNPTTTIVITDEIYNHAGEVMDRTTITYHVDETPPQADDVDIYIKDNPPDDGSVPTTAPWWVSPDIWVRTDGDCSQTVHQNPIAGRTNTICVRVRNRMATAVSNISVDLYYGSAALGLIWPGSYSIAGSAHIANLAGGDQAVVSVPWNTPNVTGHFCLLARANSPDDPLGSGLDTQVPQDHVPNNNNISMRNVNIVDYPEGECGLSTTATDTDVVYMDVVNTAGHGATVDVVFDSPDFPLDTGEIVVEPGTLWDRWSSLTGFDQADHTLIPNGFPASMNGITMEPYETAHMTLTLTAEIDVRFILQVSELVDGELVGGVDYLRELPHCVYTPLILRNYRVPAPVWVPSPEERFARDE